jgi:hypothetical protein
MLFASNRRFFNILAFLLPAVLLAFLSIYKLDYFGLDYDELLFVNAALGDLDGETFVQEKWGNIVIIVFNYIGALKSWLYIPVFKLFKVDAWSIRLPVVLMLFFNIYLSYKITRRYFNEIVAYAVFLLLSVDLTFITLQRLDKGPSAVETCIKLLVLIMVGKPESLRKNLIITGLLILGVFNKLNFLWFINALYGVTFLMNLPDVRRLLTRKLTIGQFLNTVIGRYSLIFFLLVCCNFLYIKFLGIHPAAPPLTIHELVYYFLHQLKMLKYSLLNTRIFYLFGWDLRDRALQWFGNLLLSGTVLVNLFLYVRGKVAYRSFHTAAGLLLVILFAQIVLTVEATNAWHTFILYPVLQIFIVNSFYLLFKTSDIAVRRIFWGFVAIWFCVGIYVQYAFFKMVDTECVAGELFIPQMTDLIKYTKERPENRILSVSWGVNAPLLVTGEGKKNYYEPYHLTFSRPLLDKWYDEHEKELGSPDNVLLVNYVMKQNPVYGKGYIVTSDSSFRRYERMIRSRGQEAYLQKVIKNQCGNPVYHVYKVRYRSDSTNNAQPKRIAGAK